MINDLYFPLDLAPCGVSQMLWVTMVHLFLIVLGVGETPSMAVHRPSRPLRKWGLRLEHSARTQLTVGQY
jgi:hypothetical protein